MWFNCDLCANMVEAKGPSVESWCSQLRSPTACQQLGPTVIILGIMNHPKNTGAFSNGLLVCPAISFSPGTGADVQDAGAGQRTDHPDGAPRHEPHEPVATEGGPRTKSSTRGTTGGAHVTFSALKGQKKWQSQMKVTKMAEIRWNTSSDYLWLMLMTRLMTHDHSWETILSIIVGIK